MSDFSPIKAIRRHCLDCCCGSFDEVKNCLVTKCALYNYRFGRNLNRQPRRLTEEQRAVLQERMKKLHTGNNRGKTADESLVDTLLEKD